MTEQQQDRKPQGTWRRRAGWAAVLALGVMASQAWATYEITYQCSMFCYPCGGSGAANVWGYCCEMEGSCPCHCGSNPKDDFGLTNCSTCAAMAYGANVTGIIECGCTEQCSYSPSNPCTDPGGGGGGGCSGTIIYTWSGSSWDATSGACSGECGASPSAAGCYVGQTWSCTCGAACGGPNCMPCGEGGVDGDGDGCCSDVDCDDTDASVCTDCGSGPCESNGGDGDGDGCCADVDCDDGDATKCTDCGTDPDPDPDPEEEDCGGPCEWTPQFDGEGEFTGWEKTGGTCAEDCECKEPETQERVATTTPCEKVDDDCECSDLFSTRVAAMRTKLEAWFPGVGELVRTGADTSWTIQIPFREGAPLELVVEANPAGWGFGLATAGSWLRAFVWSWSLVMVSWTAVAAVMRDLAGF